jgi:L,D-peptidoglycan transpeptidase YkuD (ErfK/YbiS/YcfS/YnhG family)
LGKGGVKVDKKEGDGATPAGTFPLRKVLYRSDRVDMPKTKLARDEITPDTGWCDDPADGEYNREVILPYPAHHEELFRDDHIYDVVVVLGYNDDPVVKGRGSAVFLHLARENYTPTEGCVAVSLADMVRILEEVSEDTVLTVTA